MPRGPRKPRLKVKKVKESGEVEVIRTREVRPSSVAVARLAPPILVTRPPIPEEPPFMYRIYRESVQRCPLSFKSLNTNASFIIVSDKERLVFVWEGSRASEKDKQLTLELALDILKRDLNETAATNEDIIHIVEGNERHAFLLEMLRVMSFKESDYRSKIARVDRAKDLGDNSEIVVGTIERRSDGDFEIMTTGHQEVNEEGVMPRINFPPILSPSSIIVVQVGDFWDLWISRGAEKEPDLEKDVKAYITKKITQRHADDPDMNAFFALEYIHIVRQGCERVLFRRHFKIFTDYEPPDRSIPWVPPSRKMDEEDESATAQKALFDALNINDTLLMDDGATDTVQSVNPFLLPVPRFAPVEAKEGDDYEEGDEPDEEEKAEMAREEARRTEGRRLCTKDMLVFNEEACVSPDERLSLLAESSINPRILMGWQVRATMHEYVYCYRTQFRFW
jgi:hypothetical protein